MKKCGLLGKNIKYSLSPIIHNNYYKENNLDLGYELFDIEEKELPIFIKNLKNSSMIGFNVTIPYKEKIVEFLDEIKYPADILKSVNTVLVKEEQLIGFNTDYFGFIASLKENSIDVDGKAALVLGLGGAAISVILALQDLNIKHIEVMVRRVEKAKNKLDKNSIFNKVKEIKNICETVGMSKYNIIINCTPIGGANYEGQSPIELKGIKAGTVVYDLNYSPEKSKLLSDAEKMGAVIINGKKMLLEQAIKAINIWQEHIEGGI